MDSLDGVTGLNFFDQADILKRIYGDSGEGGGNGGEFAKLCHDERCDLHHIFGVVIKAGKTSGSIHLTKLYVNFMC